MLCSNWQRSPKELAGKDLNIATRYVFNTATVKFDEDLFPGLPGIPEKAKMNPNFSPLHPEISIPEAPADLFDDLTLDETTESSIQNSQK